MYWYCVLCIAAFWQLLIVNEYQSINQSATLSVLRCCCSGAKARRHNTQLVAVGNSRSSTDETGKMAATSRHASVLQHAILASGPLRQPRAWLRTQLPAAQHARWLYDWRTAPPQHVSDTGRTTLRADHSACQGRVIYCCRTPLGLSTSWAYVARRHSGQEGDGSAKVLGGQRFARWPSWFGDRPSV